MRRLPATSLYLKASDTIRMPDFIRLEDNLFIAVFRLMKLLPAQFILKEGIEAGRIKPGTVIAETSSGTFALGLGMVCAEWKLPFVIFSDLAIDKFLQWRLEDLGGEVRFVGTDDPSAGDLQTLRLLELQTFLKANPDAFWPCQYDNPQNQEAYYGFADLLASSFDGPFTLVGTVGSGGSTCGAAKRLRDSGRDIKLVGIDTFGSVLFGLPIGNRLLRGLGNARMPKNLEHECFDEVHWVHEKDAFLHTRMLHREKSLFCGPTTGAAYQVARWIARRNRDENVVFIAPDEGYRYQATVYNNRWLRKMGITDDVTTREPRKVTFLHQAMPPWSYLDWGRSSLQAMLEQSSSRREP